MGTADSNIAVWWYKSFNDFNSYYVEMLDQYKMDGSSISHVAVDSLEPYTIGGGKAGLNDMIATSDKGFAFAGSTEVNLQKNIGGTYLLKLSNAIVTAVEEPVQNIGGISLYPNPASNSFMIRNTGGDFQNTTIRIYNMQGQEITSYSHINGKEFSILRNNCKEGLYVLQIIDANKTQTLKFVWQAN